MYEFLKKIVFWIYRASVGALELNVNGQIITIPAEVLRSFSDYRAMRKFPKHEPEVVDYIADNINEFDRFIDVGANLGLYCVYVQKLKASAEVFGLEAIPETFERMKKVLVANDVEDVSIKNLVVGEREGAYKVTSNEVGSSTELSTRDAKANTEVPMITLNQFVREGDGKTLVLIDVDGFELDVLRGMTNLLDKSCVVILEVHPIELSRRGHDLFEVIDFFIRNNFKGRTLRYPNDRKRDHKQIHMIFELESRYV